MPEGPEIRRAADEIARVLVDNIVVKAQLTLPALTRYQAALEGQRVTAVDTHGKAMLTRFDNGLTLYSHNQLYGRWFTTRRPKLPDTGRQLRVALHTKTHSALLYSASDIEILDETALSEHPFLSRIGPDILDAALGHDAVVARLRATQFRRRALGALYLDQHFLAGVGNYLRSEILWAARLHPKRRPEDLSTRELDRLARATLRISRRSYRSRGLTVPPSLARRLEAQGLSRGKRRFQVFGRAGERCHTCGATIEQTTMSSRNLFFCPACQPRRPG